MINHNQADIPLIAILRGVEPEQVLNVAYVLINEGFTRIEVPLNSPHALVSITSLVKEYGPQLLLGAGTVSTAEQARAAIDAGANLIVSPNFNEEVVRISKAARCRVYPGVLTPTECFAAIAVGASGLKLFPISVLGVAGFKAIKSVLPSGTECYPVGGIEATRVSMQPYLNAGATGFGLGASLYQPTMSLRTLSENAKSFIKTYKRCSADKT
jgi:2-dehydro-3-deoxyphosphogalactonate aldolase